MGFEIDINLKWFRGKPPPPPKKNDHCWQQGKAMPLRDEVIIKLVLDINRVRKVVQNQHQSAVYR